MATLMTPPSHGELWHLSIDDLLGPLPETFRLGGPGPFVINLRASTTSMTPLRNVLQGFDNVHLYQIQRIEDEALRFRLRLGPFTHEDDADAVLLKVRDTYPCALTATAVAEDLQAIESLRKPKPQIIPANAVRAATLIAVPVAVAAAVPAGVPVAVAVPMPPPTARSVTAAAAVPPAAVPAPPSIAAQPAPAQVSRMSPAPAQVAARVPHREHDLESTQTVRRLTAAELSVAQSLRWFVIELSVTDHAIDPESVPNLDIYSLYRLYSVMELDQGRRMHALRLGFFSEEIAAKAVASYLAAYYEKPTIKRVSVAERERFSQRGIEARKDVGATGMHAAIEITGDRVARPVRKSITPPP